MLSFILSVTPIEYHDKITHLYETFHDDMLRFAKSRLRIANDPDPEHNAEDVVQNCFLRISKYCESIKFDNADDYLKSYVMSVTVHEIYRFIQKQQQQCFEELDEEYVDPVESHILEDIILEERYNDIVRVIKEMDEKYSIPLFYYFVDEIPPKKIAELLDLSVKNVYTRIARGKLKLIEELKGKVME